MVQSLFRKMTEREKHLKLDEFIRPPITVQLYHSNTLQVV